MFSFTPNSILITIGPIAIHWYGLLIVAGMVAGWLIARYWFKKYQLPLADLDNLFFYLIIFGIIGARLYYVVYDWNYYANHLADIFKPWQGGLAIHGAMIAGLLTIYGFAKKKRWSFWLLTDIITTALPLGQAIGRWGNYFNQELFGRPTNLPWGILIDPANRPLGFENFSRFQPTFLYESLLDLLLFRVLFYWHRKKITNYELRITNDGRIKNGNITLAYLFGYSAIRFSMEFLRLDYSPTVFGIRWAQLLSAVVMILVVLWIVVKKIKKVKKPA